MADEIALKRDAHGHLLSPDRTKVVKVVERDAKGLIAGVTQETLAADASPDEIARAVKVAAGAQAHAMGVDVIQRAVDAAVLAVTTSAKKAADNSSALVKTALDKTLEAAKAQAATEDAERDVKGFKRREDEDVEDVEDVEGDDEDERPSFKPAASLPSKARAAAAERYRRMVAAEDQDIDEETLTALEQIVAEIDHAVRVLAKSFGMHDDEVAEDLGPPRKRRSPTTTRPLVLDERPEFRFPDASDVGRAASETSAEEDEPDDEDEGRQRRHKSRHRRVSKQRHLGSVFGPTRWQR